MLSLKLTALLPALALIPGALSQYTATYDAANLPASSEEGQYGTNACGTTAHQDSNCQNVYVNSVDDFCLWGPPSTTSDEGDKTAKIGNVEQIVVSYCLKDGYGTRLIPDGTITGAHFVKVVSDKVSYVQVTGVGDLTKLLIPAGDDGGELDPHSWTGLGNPQGGLVFTNAYTGAYEQAHEWTSFMSYNEFCIRACRDGPNAAGYCEHIYDLLSCQFTVPGDMGEGFDECEGDPTDEAPGVYGGYTFHQDDPSTPAPHPAGATSKCTAYSTIGGGNAAVVAIATTTDASASSMATVSVTSGSSSAVETTASGPVTSAASSTTAAPTSSSATASPSVSTGNSESAAGARAYVSAGVFGLVGAVLVALVI
ncbi:hypothetical protein IAT38_007298 [Cryptococcus sp. DSM 104549]